jgi:uncharacterized protein involved in exopolysaccharide biosynthesis
MDFQKFQEKLIRRATSPAELFYAISSHWLLILFLTVAGAIGLYVYKSSSTLLYEAHATLLLTPKNPIASTDFGGGLSRTEERNFVSEQIQILNSNTVIKYLVQGLSYDRVTLSDVEEETVEDTSPGVIQDVRRKLRDKWTKVVDTFSPPTFEGSLQEKKIHGAIASFRLRSDVEPRTGSNIVVLTARGPTRGRLTPELGAWIKAYRKRIGELTSDAFQRVLLERTGYWDKEIADARAELELFRTENQEVSKTMQGWLGMQVAHYQTFLFGLRSQRNNLRPTTSGQFAPVPLPSPQQTLFQDLQTRRRELETQRLELLGAKPAGSRQVETLDEKIRLVTERIDEIVDSATSTESPAMSPAPSALGPRREGELDQQIETANEELRGILLRKQAVDNNLDELQRLENAYSEALNKKREVEQLLLWSTEASEGRRIVQIQELDDPTVGLEPMNALQPLHILLGAGCGIAAGLLLAFSVELLNRRVVFKSDVVHQLDLEVLGVFPER